MRAAAAFPDALQLLSTVAWSFLKKDWGQVRRPLAGALCVLALPLLGMKRFACILYEEPPPGPAGLDPPTCLLLPALVWAGWPGTARI